VYFTGNSEVAAWSVSSEKPVGSSRLAVGSENTVSSKQPAGEVAPPVYFTGNDEIAASSADSVQPAITAPSPLERAGGEDAVYYFTGNDEPAASGVFYYSNE
jgi:hypothetical protein